MFQLNKNQKQKKKDLEMIMNMKTSKNFGRNSQEILNTLNAQYRQFRIS